MKKKFLWWLTGYLPYKLIQEGERPYLERYYLFTILGWRFYIHRFVDSDPGRGLHDHPWRRAFTFILDGWYWEETRFGCDARHWFASFTGDHFHRVVLNTTVESYEDGNRVYTQREPTPCWTLFGHTVGDTKVWGFLKPASKGKCGDMTYEPHRKLRKQENRWWETAPKRGSKPCVR